MVTADSIMDVPANLDVDTELKSLVELLGQEGLSVKELEAALAKTIDLMRIAADYPAKLRQIQAIQLEITGQIVRATYCA